MNLPNKLTVLRVIMIPFFVFFLLFKPEDIMFRGIAEAIFIVASLTDLLDGKIARKYNLVTNFGKFMDPLADKLLVCSALICLLSLEQLPTWVVIVIIAREFIISGFRLVAANANIVIAANMWGKSKTVSQMFMIILLILNLKFEWYQMLCLVLIYVATALTIISLVTYLYQNKEVLADQN
jgi:CDP-diacylglycerol--glycerol-3-phosphate 3-phosphatidyltransferase